jgi:hypothetical protein
MCSVNGNNKAATAEEETMSTDHRAKNNFMKTTEEALNRISQTAAAIQ